MPVCLSEARRSLRTLLVLAPLAASLLVGGCGGNTATSGGFGNPDASLVTAVTQGGGLPGESSGASSGGGSGGSGGSSGSGPSSGVGSSGMASSGGSSGSTSVLPADAGLAPDGSIDCSGYMPAPCGSTPCDLRSNTCCVTLLGQARCLPGAHAQCASNEVTGHCWYTCDCPNSGMSCCAVGNSVTQTVASECQVVPAGGHCQPYPMTSTMTSAQLCGVTAECKNGENCIKQTCVYNTTFQICGLQSQDPFYCH